MRAKLSSPNSTSLSCTPCTAPSVCGMCPHADSGLIQQAPGCVERAFSSLCEAYRVGTYWDGHLLTARGGEEKLLSCVPRGSGSCPLGGTVRSGKHSTRNLRWPHCLPNSAHSLGMISTPSQASCSQVLAEARLPKWLQAASTSLFKPFPLRQGPLSSFSSSRTTLQEAFSSA